jgi:glycosyltransferase involved in cell wall biosynthesis
MCGVRSPVRCGEMKPSAPAVSIIVLSYNRAAYLRVALDSVATQTDRSYEVVIADDCSPDPAVDGVLKDYASRFEHFVYERPERNVGVVANLRRAIDLASGRHITILCDDDALEPGYIARMRETLDADPSLAVAFCGVTIIDSDGTPDAKATRAFAELWGRDRLESGLVESTLTAALVTRSLQPAMGATFRRDAIAWNDFPDEAAGAWDLWLGYLAARDGRRCAYVDESLFRYRVHPGALTMRRDVRWHRGQVYIYARFLTDQRLASLQSIFRQRLARYHAELGMALLRQGEHAEARKVFRRGRKFGTSVKSRLGTSLSYLPTSISAGLFRVYDR